MSYFEDKKKELESVMSLIRQEKSRFEIEAKREREELDEKIKWNEKLKEGIKQMAKERQVGFPWLAKAYEELLFMRDKKLAEYLNSKEHPALRASEVVKEQSRLRREAVRDKKIAEYLVAYYENIAPFLVDLKEEVDVGSDEDKKLLKEYSEEELQDFATHYLTKEEYRKLPSVERNQMALDRFWSRSKSKWLIGRIYERFVGYLYEQKGYNVEYVGIFKGYEDLGRDLICKKGNEIIVIQCKYWSQFRTIYEKHIFQFFGTVFQYKDENKDKKVKAVFYTTTKVSDLARRFAQELGIQLEENYAMDKQYPCIKCNISKVDKTKIYHLPFDQQYDNTKIEEDCAEFYCATVKEAEGAGFRRAFKYQGLKIKK